MNNLFELFNQYLGKIPYAEMVPYAAIVLPAVVFVLSLVIANHGKKLLNVLKFVICAGAGYYLGSSILWGYIEAFVAPYGVTSLIVGIVLAVIFALLSKLAYAVVFAAAFGYVAYLYLPGYVAVLNGNLVYTIVAAVAVGVVALIFRGLLETVLTAVAGGAGFSLGLYSTVVAITAAFGLGVEGTSGIRLNYEVPVLSTLTFETVAILVVALIVCLVGFIKQVKNRHRY